MILDYLKTKMFMFKDNEKENPFQARTLKYEAQDMLDEKSMHTILPALHDFPFMGSTSFLDVYKMYNV